MAVSPDGATLYIGSANVLRRVDTGTLQVRDTWPTPDPIRGMAVHPDGDQLLLGQRDHITRIDATTGKVLDTFTTADLRTVYTSRDRW